MSRGPDAGTLLARAIVADAARHGCAVVLDDADWTRWASATFTGARHTLTLVADESGLLSHWLAALPETDLPIRHHLVADLSVVAVRRSDSRVRADIEALTVEQ